MLPVPVAAFCCAGSRAVAFMSARSMTSPRPSGPVGCSTKREWRDVDKQIFSRRRVLVTPGLKMRSTTRYFEVDHRKALGDEMSAMMAGESGVLLVIDVQNDFCPGGA